jgi:ubiquinone/menaquinone biosynthesis C-methylase UbiE
LFVCPKCYHALWFFYPDQCVCVYVIPKIDSVYQFSDEPPVSLDQPGQRYLGYENVGENYEGCLEQEVDDYGIFGGCSRELVRLLGKGCIVLDLGTGLGPAAITLAVAGANTIAVDVSQRMLAIAAQRAAGRRMNSHLAFARMNAYNLAISNKSVDAVVAVDVLHQLDNPAVAVKEIIRVLKPGGVFIEYDSVSLPLTPEQHEINRRCSEALRDIRNHYYAALTKHGYAGPPFSSWEEVRETINRYFSAPELLPTDYVGVWTEKMRKGINKLKTRASGGAQLIPDDVHAAAWDEAHKNAVRKYGHNYIDIPGYSRYSGVVKVYRPKNEVLGDRQD